MQEKIGKSEENKDWVLLLNSTNLIRNKEIREFTKAFLEERVPDYFAIIPAAQHAEHHMAASLGEGGLVRHTLSILVVLQDLVNLEYLQFKNTDKDLIMAAAIMHDTFKHGKDPSEGYQRSHPNIAAQEILKFAKERGQENLGKILGNLVVAHMGQWGNQKPGNRGQFIVHLGDYIASRKYFTISFDPLYEELEKRAKEQEAH